MNILNLGPNIFRHILSFLPNDFIKTTFLNKKTGHISNVFKQNIIGHYHFPTIHTLIYGQVQSGKTNKIMEYIESNKQPKVLIIQNSVNMLKQYIHALQKRKITYSVLQNNMTNHEYHGQNVLITIHNKYRLHALHKYLLHNRNQLQSINLVLDESDQYLKKIKKQPVYINASHVLHVTATPFIFNNKNNTNMIDNVIVVPPIDSYTGIHEVEIIEINTQQLSVFNTIVKIIQHDFTKQQQGIMLITCFPFVVDMKSNALNLSTQFPTIPIIVVCTHTFVYVNGAINIYKQNNIQKMFDLFGSHAIIIANRMANRGLNYTDSNFTRNITHQISFATNNYTSFIQKCRIFGTRPVGLPKPVIYCLINKPSLEGFKLRLFDKINQIKYITDTETPPVKQPVVKITVKLLRDTCKSNGIKKYSWLNKAELIQLLLNNNIHM